MRSKTDRQFRGHFAKLPPDVQQRAHAAFQLWIRDPFDRKLKFKRLQHSEPLYSVRIGKRWRALGLWEGDVIVWIWIGPHDEYLHVIRTYPRSLR